MRAIQEVSKINPIWGIYFEGCLFNLANQFCGDAYGGGQWTSTQTKDGSWIALPPIKGKFRVTSPDNGYEGETNALTVGAAITCIALNRTLWAAHQKLGDAPLVHALSDLWDNTTEACKNIEDPNFDKAAFYGIID